MSTTTLQYAIAGFLGLAWVWMLGRPLLVRLVKNSRRNSIGYFREQQAALASAGEYPEPELSWWGRRPQPMSSWFAQSTERRRLQTLLGSAFATFGTLLLAIALKGMFWSLFLVSLVCFVAYICFASYVGASRLRHQEAQNRVRRQTVVSAEMERRSLIAQSIVEDAPDQFEQQSIFHQQSLFSGLVSESVEHESDPDLVIDGLEDEYLDDDDLHGEDLHGDEVFAAEEIAHDTEGDFDADGQHEADDELFEPIVEFSLPPLDVRAEVADMVRISYTDDKVPADFEPDPTTELMIDHLDSVDRVSKPLRPKPTSRPIYIESQLDSVDERRAVND